MSDEAHSHPTEKSGSSCKDIQICKDIKKGKGSFIALYLAKDYSTDLILYALVTLPSSIQQGAATDSAQNY